MKVGLIAPIKLLDKYCTTNVQYVLPSLYSESRIYRDFYDGRGDEGDIVMLDCKRIGWKREPEDISLCVEVAYHLQPSLIILPSYMYNLTSTIEVAYRYTEEFRDIKLVGCLEGTTHKEAQRCMRAYHGMGLNSFAVPSHMHNVLAKVDSKEVIYVENHLKAGELVGLEGILVTSLPVRLGLQGRLLSDYFPSPPSLTFHEEEDPFPMVVERNIKEALRYYEDK